MIAYGVLHFSGFFSLLFTNRYGKPRAKVLARESKMPAFTSKKRVTLLSGTTLTGQALVN